MNTKHQDLIAHVVFSLQLQEARVDRMVSTYFKNHPNRLHFSGECGDYITELYQEIARLRVRKEQLTRCANRSRLDKFLHPCKH